MHMPAYRMHMWVGVGGIPCTLCTLQFSQTAKLFGGALAVCIRCPTTVPFLHRCVCVCMLRGIVFLRERRRLLVPSRV